MLGASNSEEPFRRSEKCKDAIRFHICSQLSKSGFGTGIQWHYRSCCYTVGTSHLDLAKSLRDIMEFSSKTILGSRFHVMGAILVGFIGASVNGLNLPQILIYHSRRSVPLGRSPNAMIDVSILSIQSAECRLGIGGLDGLKRRRAVSSFRKDRNPERALAP